MKKHIKQAFQISLITLVLLFIVDQFLAFLKPNALYPQHYDISDYHRAPKPYIGFSGKQDVLDHNEFGYRWEIDKGTDNTYFKIAFFGGSTGYAGDPPIATLLENYLKSEFGEQIKVANFSVVSSNHRQHIHNIIESNSLFKPDLIVFYGGYNETAQHAFYDPRPGYPYNFYYRDETSHWRKLLLERSPTANLLNRVGTKTGLFDLTPLSKLREDIDLEAANGRRKLGLFTQVEEPVYSEAWKTEVLKTYFETLSYANVLANALGSSRCSEHFKFRAFYQPYQIPDNLKSLDSEIRRDLRAVSYIYDVSDAFVGRDDVYTDIVHVTQEGNEIMAQKMFNLLKAEKNILSCLEKISK